METIARKDPRYPESLGEISDPPETLYIKGALPREDVPMIAIVGTRRATPGGKQTAKAFASALARRGFAIVSGLAFGIDAASHEGCLDAGGITIAVLACGVDRVYPRSNERLGEQILTGSGAIVSEYPPGTEPLAYRFLERNRIVSGLCRGVLVVECPDGSGSLVTARLAAEQGRDVFVVPGPISHPNFAGSHELIRKGAELVTKPEDILEAWEISGETDEERLMTNDITDEERIILTFLEKIRIPADVDKIIEMTKLDPQTVNRTVSFLYIKEAIKETPSGYVLN